MIVRNAQPAPPSIADVVTEIAVFSGKTGSDRWDRVYPTGTIELLINFGEGVLRCRDPRSGQSRTAWGPTLGGVQHHDFLIDPRQLENLLSLELHPGAIWRLFGVPAWELADQHVELDRVARRQLDPLIAHLQRRTARAGMVDVVESALRRWPRHASHPAVQWAVDQICRYPDAVRVSHLAEEAGLSRRRLNELFRREVGTSPKQFIRLRRFRGVLQWLNRSDAPNGATLAQTCGYADQPHFIRDFRDFTGQTPRAYRASRLSAAASPTLSFA
jgi:AraC-like DNA-binding protein